jgi:branched-subunit amino acid transport protein
MTDIWLVVGAGAFATFMWRFAGIVIARHVDPDSLLMVWVNAAAHAMVAGVMSIILVYPVGSLASTELEYRLASFAVALIVMLIFRKLALAIAVGIISFIFTQTIF